LDKQIFRKEILIVRKILKNMTELNKIGELSDSLKRYFILNIEIIKLEATRHLSNIGPKFITSIIVGVFLFMFVISLNIGAGLYLSTLFNDLYTGFAIVSGFNLLIAVVLLIGRKKIIENPFRDKIIKKILEEKE
jgi:hypothetical protein